jgi:hypothetical protein
MNRSLFNSTIYLCLFLLILSSCGSNKISLWNGKDFSGWTFSAADGEIKADEIWSIKNGVIHCTGIPNGYMQTESEFENYILYVEWRWVEKEGNSGVFLHTQESGIVWPNCIECQLKSGNAGDFVLIGKGSITVNGKSYINEEGFKGVRKMQESSEKPGGEWNSYKIICDEDKITCYVNDVLQNEGINASLTKGKICLQSEGAPVEFRNIYLELLK